MSTTDPDEPGRPSAERRLAGIPVAAGIAIGRVFRATEVQPTVARHRIHATDIEAESARLETAILQSRKQLGKLRARLGVLPEQAHAEIAPLLDGYLQMLGGSRLVRGARRRIAEKLVAAETAVLDECEAIAAAFGRVATDDPATLLRQAEEVREIGRRLVRNLTRAPFRSFVDVPEGAVLVAEALRPADAALLNPARLAGVATEEGGSDGHTAVMLRALGIPSVLGVPGLLGTARPAEMIVIDGAAGDVVLGPGEDTLAGARRKVTAFAAERHRLSQLRRLPAETRDGVSIELQANLELPAELPLIARAGVHGIGLLRSEFLFMNRERLPDADDQADTYRQVIEAMGGDPVTIRVLDWGGEKEIEALESEGIVPAIADRNPALTLRGIRLLLRQPALFETQLTAILRAAAATQAPVRVLLPMVTTAAEIRGAKEAWLRVVERMRHAGERLPERLPPIGIMIETPGAALSADALAQEADFFALGTNDLTMYTLAVDRGESEVAHLYDPLHPAVLRLVQFAADAARRVGKPISVCGELAANASVTPLLLGLGIASFSMNASAVPLVKQAIRRSTLGDCVRLARRVMEQSDLRVIARMVADFDTG